MNKYHPSPARPAARTPPSVHVLMRQLGHQHYQHSRGRSAPLRLERRDAAGPAGQTGARPRHARPRHQALVANDVLAGTRRNHWLATVGVEVAAADGALHGHDVGQGRRVRRGSSGRGRRRPCAASPRHGGCSSTAATRTASTATGTATTAGAAVCRFDAATLLGKQQAQRCGAGGGR